MPLFILFCIEPFASFGRNLMVLTFAIRMFLLFCVNRYKIQN
jgi:hypothetical protein